MIRGKGIQIAEVTSRVIVVCLIVVSAWVVWNTYTKKFVPPETRSSKSTQIWLPSFDGFDHTKATLVFGLSTSCHFCFESVPFYRKLIDENLQLGSPVNLIAVFREDNIFVDNFLSKKRLVIPSVANFQFDELRVTRTPTLILINSKTKTAARWEGQLDEYSEREVADLIRSLQYR